MIIFFVHVKQYNKGVECIRCV